MLPLAQTMATIAFLGITYPIISILFRERKKNQKLNLILSIIVVGIAVAVKLFYDTQDLKPNYYALLNVNRRSTAMEIRQAYKKVSLKYHPDKNTASDAEEKFQSVKAAYDVLMDEQKRDIYNRFGVDAIKFDPRSDELKLIVGLGVVYLFWSVVSYIATLPKSAHACRTWIAIVLVAMLIGEVFLCLTETSLPAWMPSKLTEHEFALCMHAVFPGIIVLLRSISEYLYVDIDRCTLLVLSDISKHHKAMGGLLHQLQVLLTPDERSHATAPMEDIQRKIEELRQEMQDCNDQAADTMELLKSASSNPGSNYYWLIFVLIYGSVYFFQ